MSSSLKRSRRIGGWLVVFIAHALMVITYLILELRSLAPYVNQGVGVPGGVPALLISAVDMIWLLLMFIGLVMLITRRKATRWYWIGILLLGVPGAILQQSFYYMMAEIVASEEIKQIAMLRAGVPLLIVDEQHWSAYVNPLG